MGYGFRFRPLLIACTLSLFILSGLRSEILYVDHAKQPLESPDEILKWKVDLGNLFYCSPAVDSYGTIYIPSNNELLYAISPDGAIRWEYPIGRKRSPAAAVGRFGNIILGSGNSALHFIGPDGSRRCRYLNMRRIAKDVIINYGPFSSAAAVGHDGTIYIGSALHGLFAFYYDGKIKGGYGRTGSIESSPSVDSEGRIYFGSDNNSLWVVNSDFTLEWRFDTGDKVRTCPALGADGTVFFGSDDGFLYAVSGEGVLNWKFEAGGAIRSSPVLGTDGKVYFGSDDGSLYALDSEGILNWKYATADTVRSAPSVGADGTVYVGSYDSCFHAVNHDGTLKWKYRTGGRIVSSAAINENGTVYFGSEDGFLYALESGTAQGLAESPWPKGRRDLENTGRVGESLANIIVNADSTVGPLNSPAGPVGIYIGSKYPITSISLELLFDNNNIQIDSISPAEAFADAIYDASSLVEANSTGILRLTMADLTGSDSIAPGYGMLAAIYFRDITGVERMDTLRLSNVSVTGDFPEEPELEITNGSIFISWLFGGTCDINRDGKIDIADVISFLLIARDNTNDPRLNWRGVSDGDGEINIADVISFLLIASGNTNDPRLNWKGVIGDYILYPINNAITLILAIRDKKDCPDFKTILASAAGESEITMIEGLSSEEIAWLESILPQLNLTAEEEAAFRLALYGESPDAPSLPQEFSLSQNSPNPFNPSTTINYTVPEGSKERVYLNVYNLRGALVRILVDRVVTPGIHQVFWDGTDNSGRQVGSGPYFYRLEAGDFVRIRKMVLLK